MLENFYVRFHFQETTTKIWKINELVSHRYCNVTYDIIRQIDRIVQRKVLKTTHDYAVQIGTFIASIEVSEFSTVTEAIKTLAENDINWETVTDRII